VRILVTGGAGFIGSHTVDALLARGDTVRVLDALRPPVHLDGRWPAELSQDIERLHGDVREKKVWETALEGVDAVLHFAAYQDYLPDFGTFFATNTVGTALLYEVIVERRFPVRKVVVASSQAVYGEGRYRCSQDGEVYPGMRREEQLRQGMWEILCPHCGGELTPEPTDECRVHPQNAYGVSKYSQEQLALTLGRRYGIPTVAMRYSIVQGARQSIYNAYSGACRIFCTAVRAGRRPVVYEDGRQLRDFVNIHDVVAANLLVLDDPRADDEVFNVGGPKVWTVLEFAEVVIRCAGVNLSPVIPGEYRFGDTRHIVSDCTKLRALGWEPRRMAEESIREYLAWLDTIGTEATTASETAYERMKGLGVVRHAGRYEVTSDRFPSPLNL
jgi:dTDP-L-rhamnose 4-epimerase